MFSKLELAQQLFDYYTSRNVQGFISLLHPDIIWIEPGDSDIPYAGRFEGLAEVKMFLERVAINQQFTAFILTDLCESLERVVAMGYSNANVLSTGKSYHTDWAYALTFRQEKISGVQVYMDTLAMAKANSR